MKPSILEVCSEALTAYEKGITTSTENISSSSDPNYSRQTVNFFTNYQNGYSVDARTETIHDNFLTSQVQTLTAQKNEAEVIEASLSRIDKLISGFQGQDQSGPYNFLNRKLQEVFKAFSSLMTNDSKEARTNVVAKLGEFSHIIKTIDENIRQEKLYVESEIDDAVKKVNTLAAQVADVNSRISNSLPSKQEVYVRSKENLMNELSKYIQVKSTGSSSSVFIYGGHSIVHKKLAISVSASKDEYGKKTNIRLEKSKTLDENKMSGRLGGLLKLRNSILEDVHQKIGLFAATVITRFNQINQQGSINFYGTQANKTSAKPQPKGSPIFNPILFDAEASNNNQGTAKIKIEVGTEKTEARKLRDTMYEIVVLKPNAQHEDQYKIRDVQKESFSSPMKTQDLQKAIPGISLQVQGTPKEDDRFLIFPLEHASSGIRVITDPEKIALSNNDKGVGLENSKQFLTLANEKVMHEERNTLTQGMATIFAEIGAKTENSQSIFTTIKKGYKQTFERKESLVGVSVQEEFLKIMSMKKIYSAVTRVIASDQETFKSLLSVIGV